MSDYPLLIITPLGKAFEGRVNSLIAPGASGSFGVLKGHAPMVIALRNGPLTIKEQDKESYFAVSSGVLEVNARSEVLLLADSAAKTQTYQDAKSAASRLLSLVSKDL